MLLHWEPHVRWSLPFSPQRFSCLRSSQWRPLASPEPWLYTSPGSPAWWAPPRSSKPSDHRRSATHRQVAHSLSPERRTRKGRCDIWEWDRIKAEVVLWWVSITQSSLLYTEICSFQASFTELFVYFVYVVRAEYKKQMQMFVLYLSCFIQIKCLSLKACVKSLCVPGWHTLVW